MDYNDYDFQDEFMPALAPAPNLNFFDEIPNEIPDEFAPAPDWEDEEVENMPASEVNPYQQLENQLLDAVNHRDLTPVPGILRGAAERELNVSTMLQAALESAIWNANPAPIADPEEVGNQEAILSFLMTFVDIYHLEINYDSLLQLIISRKNWELLNFIDLYPVPDSSWRSILFDAIEKSKYETIQHLMDIIYDVPTIEDAYELAITRYLWGLAVLLVPRVKSISLLDWSLTQIVGEVGTNYLLKKILERNPHQSIIDDTFKSAVKNQQDLARGTLFNRASPAALIWAWNEPLGKDFLRSLLISDPLPTLNLMFPPEFMKNYPELEPVRQEALREATLSSFKYRYEYNLLDLIPQLNSATASELFRMSAEIDQFRWMERLLPQIKSNEALNDWVSSIPKLTREARVIDTLLLRKVLDRNLDPVVVDRTFQTLLNQSMSVDTAKIQMVRVLILQAMLPHISPEAMLYLMENPKTREWIFSNNGKFVLETLSLPKYAEIRPYLQPILELMFLENANSIVRFANNDMLRLYLPWIIDPKLIDKSYVNAASGYHHVAADILESRASPKLVAVWRPRLNAQLEEIQRRQLRY